MTKKLIESDQTIQNIVEDGLCTGCGTCSGMCPQTAIEMLIDDEKGTYFPNINHNKCTECGICVRVCPGTSVDFRHFNTQIFGKEPEDILIGNYLNFYIGHSTDDEIRYNSTSGGLITQLLIHALENGIIDGALVTKMNNNDPLRPEPFIAKTKEEIINASKSKYCPVPANMILKEILKTDGKFAIVGLPCHIHGVQKAMSINKKLREKIHLTFGIMCSLTRNFFATEYILKKLNINKEDVTKLDYRGKGYFGRFQITLKDGTKTSKPFHEINQWLRTFFTPPRCTLCSDHAAELCDISFGDNWMPEFQNEKVGTSVVILRTKRAETLLNSALESKVIELTSVDRTRLVQSKMDTFLRKKRYITARIAIFNFLGKKTPVYNQHLLKTGLFDYIGALLTYFQIYISQKRYLWWSLNRVAFFLEFVSNLMEK